jgi:transcriptional regulator with XRE-family HTH domain
MAKAVAVLDGVLFRRALRRFGLTQKEFAQKVHLREATISDAARGHPLSAEHIYTIALALELADEAKP